ncbi:MAG: DinB family protein [Spirochaetes bacterium]|nr:DinB family protein [Spirochaetota bacterium]
MDKREYIALVGAYEHAYDAISEKVSSLGPAELHYLPPIQDAWSINEHLVHLLDADCNAVLRIRGAIAEPGKKVPVWDQEAWKTLNKYGSSDGLYCLDLAVSLRKFLAESLRNLPEKVREASCVEHPERGPLSLYDVLSIYTSHTDFHLKYIERNLAAYASR